MDAVPEPPLVRHVWAWSTWPPKGNPAPAVVVGWHLNPDRSYQSPWQVQIAVQHTPGSIAVVWVPEQRITPVTDHTPGQPQRGVRHIWVTPDDAMPPAPGILVDWRHTPIGWEALCATVTDTTMLLDWTPAATITPIADDSWSPPKLLRLKHG